MQIAVRFLKHFKSHKVLSGILLIYSILAIIWNISVPIFEGPDAYFHYAVIDHIHKTGELPPRERPEAYSWKQMTFHAPLYYLTSALLISPINTDDFARYYPVNPHAKPGEVGAEDNLNFVSHLGTALQGTDLAVRIIRVWSAVLGGITIVGVYYFVYLLNPAGNLPERKRLIATVAAGFVAFNPQFLFIHNIVSNDTLVSTLSTWGLVLLLYILDRDVHWRMILTLSLVMGMTVLSKASGALLYPVVGLAVLFSPLAKPVPFKRRLAYLGIIAAGGIMIAGWWYIWNWVTLGDLTATSYIATVTGARVGGITDLIGELRGMYFSYWGLFGWFNILAPTSFYNLTTAITLLGIFGFIVWSIQHLHMLHQRILTIGILVLYVFLFIGSWWVFHLQVNAAQGRLFFPLIAIFAYIAAIGLIEIYRHLGIAAILTLAIAAFVLPIRLVGPTYQADAPIATADTWQAPDDTAKFSIREPWNEESCLTVWTLPITWDEDGIISIDTWWQTNCAVGGNWSVFIHYIDVNQETCVAGITDYILSQTDSMLMGGNLPFPTMQDGAVYTQTLHITPPDTLNPDCDCHVQIGIYDAAGTFMRAFVREEIPVEGITIGQCAPESIQFDIGTAYFSRTPKHP